MAGAAGQDNGAWGDAGTPLRLVIGDRNYSSWSLRPWLLMTMFGIPFETVLVRLRQPETKSEILALSPSGKVPALHVGEAVVWDSLAIAETLHELYPEKSIWPANPRTRAQARSIAAEMHAGFADLRRDMPMDWLGRLPMPPLTPGLEADIRRIADIWSGCRAQYREQGPFLFGRFSAADAMFAPVASRFRTYGVDPDDFAQDRETSVYARALLEMPELEDWTDGARAEIAAQSQR